MNNEMSMKTLEALKVVFQETLAKMGVEETSERMLALADASLAIYPILKAEEDSQNRCHAPVKSGDKKGQECGRMLKDGQCAVHKAEIRPPAQCSTVLTSGDNKGRACGKICASGETRCGLHARLPEAGSGCDYVFGRGELKGARCDKKRKDGCAFCASHAAEKPKSNSKEKKKEEKEEEKLKCVRRAGRAVVKGTCVAVDPDTTDIVGYVSADGDEWTFRAEWHESMADVAAAHGLACPFKPKPRLLLDDE